MRQKIALSHYSNGKRLRLYNISTTGIYIIQTDGRSLEGIAKLVTIEFLRELETSVCILETTGRHHVCNIQRTDESLRKRRRRLPESGSAEVLGDDVGRLLLCFCTRSTHVRLISAPPTSLI